MILESKFVKKVIEHKFFILILILGSLLLFSNLGNRCFHGDLARDAVLAKNVLSYGYPNPWDGENIVCEANGNCFKRLGNHYVWILQPWLIYYITAVSYLLLGVNTFSALFPFALIGLFSIFLSYFLVIKISKDKEIAIITTLLLTLSVQFLLLTRAGRYFALSALLTILILYFYLNFLENRKGSIIGFVISGILLFHTNYVSFFGTISGIIAHFLLFEFMKERVKPILLSLLCIFLFTAPWLLLFSPSLNIIQVNLFGKSSIKETLFLFAHYLLKINNHLFPFLLFILIPSIMIKREGNKLSVNSRYILILLVIGFMLSTFPLYNAVRNLAGITPLFCLLSASIYKFIKVRNKIIAYVILILLLFTNIINVTPTILFKSCISLDNFANIISFVTREDKEKIVEKLKGKDADKKIEGYAQIKFPILDFIYDITHDYDNAIEGIVKYLQKHGKKDETVMIRSLEGMESNIIFYTGMKVIYNISDRKELALPTEDFLKLNQSPPGGIDWYIKIPHHPLDYMPEGKYEKIIIDYPQTWFDSYPQLPSYQFKTLKDAPRVVIYHKVKNTPMTR